MNLACSSTILMLTFTSGKKKMLTFTCTSNNLLKLNTQQQNYLPRVNWSFIVLLNFGCIIVTSTS